MESHQQQTLNRYAGFLRDSPHNLVSAADRARVWERHVGEGVAVAKSLAAHEGERWIDVGTGGGLPGLVIAVMRPDLAVVLLEAKRKKITAVGAFIGDIGIANADVVVGRAEDVARDPAQRGAFDGGIARAVGPVTVSVELVRGFIAPGGSIVIVRGQDGPECVGTLQRVADRLRVVDIEAHAVPDAVRTTWLVRMRAEGPVPGWLPRANGIPRSRPLED